MGFCISVVTQPVVAVVMGIKDRYNRLGGDGFDHAQGHLTNLDGPTRIQHHDTFLCHHKGDVTHHALVLWRRKTVGRVNQPDSLGELLGFDVLDDIVDHSYDNDYNIVDRIYKAVYNNRLILGNSDLAKNTWFKVQDRIAGNAERAKNLFAQADLYLDQEFAKIKWK